MKRPIPVDSTLQTEFPNKCPSKMSILWNGGWDEYIVDLNDMIDDPSLGTTDYWPTVRASSGNSESLYVRTLFSGEMNIRFPGKAIYILRHTGGGD